MEGLKLRKIFLDFYKERGHVVISSASLIPKDDPTLLFTTAGMVPFKPLYAGTVPLPYKRATSCQKCLRLSDLAKVGFSPKYLTFFEMLGNFSFGDYFKKEALIWAWEFLTETLKLDKKRLYVSIFREDDEAFSIWHKIIGLNSKRIYKLGEEDNFWGPAGGIGACGPCSEIYYDLGEEFSCRKEDCAPGCSCDRFLELYNIVFPSYDQQANGERLPLKNRGIDTGMGLERAAMAAQNKKSVFETDLFAFIVRKLKKICNLEENSVFFNLASDHIRALTFAIADGVFPSNEGRGYVLRLLLRRVLVFYYKFFKKLPTSPFLYELPAEIIYNYACFYPELKDQINKVSLIIKEEESKFLQTINKAMIRFKEVVYKLKRKGEKVILGEKLFFLHDTFGLNVELIEELAKEEGLLVDIEGFKKIMAERDKRKIILKEAPKKLDVIFVGYEKLESESEVVYLKKVGEDEYEAIINPTPFYSSKGGQVGDRGKIIYQGEELEVIDSYYEGKVPILRLKAKSFLELLNKKVLAKVDYERRAEIARAHTLTHLLHQALKLVLGKEVRQEGSLVDAGRLHFDFNFSRPLKKDEILEIERIIFSKILENIKVEKYYNILQEEARAMGALALFEYEKRVNVIKIGDFSCEVCAGTHLNSTSEIGIFKIINESAVATGIRRIEAECGKKAFYSFIEKYKKLEELKKELQVSEEQLIKKVKEILAAQKEKERKRDKLIEWLLPILANNLSGEKIKDIEIIIEDYSFLEKDEIRRISDYIKKREKSVGVFLKKEREHLAFIISVSFDLVARLKADELSKRLATFLEGGGGGRTDLGEGGGKIKKIADIKNFIFSQIEKL